MQIVIVTRGAVQAAEYPSVSCLIVDKDLDALRGRSKDAQDTEISNTVGSGQTSQSPTVARCHILDTACQVTVLHTL